MPTTIVMSRILDDFEIVGRARIDIGESHKTRDIKVARALIWKNAVSDRKLAVELQRAEEYAKKSGEGYAVFAYPSSERNPLDRAKRDLLIREKVPAGMAYLYQGPDKPLARL